MKPSFDRALQALLGMEGGYSDHPADRGGKTRYGVTEAVARKYGYAGAMRDYPLRDAVRVYRAAYWTPFGFDGLADHQVAAFLFDCAVNHGGAGMARIAQRAARYRVPEVDVDGKWGPQTRSVITQLTARYPANLLGALKLERGKFFLSLVERRPDQRVFLWGWLKRCA